jgi:transcriptional regulator with XRE-family HTH domain
MGKAGRALRQTLEKYKISQYKLAEVMGIERNNISRWVREERDPTAEKVVGIVKALSLVNHEAALDFCQRFLLNELDQEN